MFEQGKKNAPCIVYLLMKVMRLEEADSSGIGGGHDELEHKL